MFGANTTFSSQTCLEKLVTLTFDLINIWWACLVFPCNFSVSLAAAIILQKLVGFCSLLHIWTSLSPRLRLYYLLLYYTTPTFTPVPGEWEVIANANELCVGLLWARVWVGRTEHGCVPQYLLAWVSTCVPNAEHVWSSSAGARLRTRSFYLTSCTCSSDL